MVDTDSEFITFTPFFPEALASQSGIVVCNLQVCMQTLLIFNASMEVPKPQCALNCRESFTSCGLRLPAVISSHSRLIW